MAESVKLLSSNSVTIESELVLVKRYQCVGKRFAEFSSKYHSKHGHANLLSNASSESDISDDNSVFEVDVDYLRSLDPKEWKDQDHYAVLGLKKLR